MNFNAGPATLPLPALERARDELLDFAGSGMSVMEHSHRGKEYEAVHDEAIALLTRLLTRLDAGFGPRLSPGLGLGFNPGLDPRLLRGRRDVRVAGLRRPARHHIRALGQGIICNSVARDSRGGRMRAHADGQKRRRASRRGDRAEPDQGEQDGKNGQPTDHFATPCSSSSPTTTDAEAFSVGVSRRADQATSL